MTRCLTTAMGVLLATLLCAPGVSAAGLQLSEAGGAKFPERAFLLTLPTRASIPADQVRVRENGQLVEEVDATPGSALNQRQFGTVLVIDASLSVRGEAIKNSVRAARSFARQRNAEQPLAIVTFNGAVRTVLPFTTDGAAIQKALASPPPLAAQTHIYDATTAALDLLERGKVTSGSVIVLSDGDDTGSKSTQQSVARDAKEARARIYTVGLRTRSFQSTTLRTLAAATGGVYTEASDRRLAAVYRDLGETLSNQYVVRYRSAAPLDTKVRVAARVPGFNEVAFTSYRAPKIPSSAPVLDGEGDSFWATTKAAVLVSVICALLLALAILALLAPKHSVRSRVEQFVTPPPRDDARAWSGALLQRALGTDDEGRRRKSGSWSSFARDLELAGIATPADQFGLRVALATLLVGGILALVGGAAAILALVIPLAALLVVRTRVERQRRAFADQLPDNLQVVSSAMRSGATFVGALATVVEDAPEPSRREFRRVLADEQLGVPMADVLKRVADRMKSRDFEHVALVVNLQRETGGNTAEVIDLLTETIRERIELRRIVRTLTAQGRLTRVVVSSLPVVLLVFLSIISPDYVRPLFHEAAGIAMLILAVIMLVAGSYTIKRIVDIEV